MSSTGEHHQGFSFPSYVVVQVDWSLNWLQGSDAYTLFCFLLFQFAQQEEKRQKAERLHQQQKHETQMKDMLAQCESNTNELQQLQVPMPPGLASQGCSKVLAVVRSGCRELELASSALPQRLLWPCLDMPWSSEL